MKKFLFVLTTLALVAILCFTLVGCSGKSANDKQASEGGDSLRKDTGAESTESNQNEHASVPLSISFSSIAEMEAFLDSAKGNASQYEEFMKETNILTDVSQSRAQTVVANMKQNDIPLVESSGTVDAFGATYYFDRNELDMVYKINGLRYRFIYQYDEAVTPVRTTAPVLEGLHLGNYTLDLYQGDACLVGEIVTDSAIIRVIVYAEQPGDVALNVFSMGNLANNAVK